MKPGAALTAPCLQRPPLSSQRFERGKRWAHSYCSGFSRGGEGGVLSLPLITALETLGRHRLLSGTRVTPEMSGVRGTLTPGEERGTLRTLYLVSGWIPAL